MAGIPFIKHVTPQDAEVLLRPFKTKKKEVAESTTGTNWGAGTALVGRLALFQKLGVPQVFQYQRQHRVRN